MARFPGGKLCQESGILLHMKQSTYNVCMLVCGILFAILVDSFGEIPVNKHSAFNCQFVRVVRVTQIVNTEDHYVPGTNVLMEDANVMGGIVGYNVSLTVRLRRQTAKKMIILPFRAACIAFTNSQVCLNFFSSLPMVPKTMQ